MLNVPEQINSGVVNFLRQKFNQDIATKDFSLSSGGCINKGGKLRTSQGVFFLKWNDAKKFPDMFEAEAKGLNLLATANAIHIPKVIGAGESSPYQFILMEFIESRTRSMNHWEVLGKELASLHKNSSSAYGLDHDNYIGSLPQFNNFKNSWVEFFISQRLNIQLKIGIDSHSIERPLVKKFDALYKKLPSILHEEKPSLVHGDLWSGNLITDEKGNPCLIDPAVYYGNREVDLAMTQLFGGFHDSFYQSYRNSFPLEPGYQERLDIYNLYPLLVHVNLFGQSYLSQVLTILQNFS